MRTTGFLTLLVVRSNALTSIGLRSNAGAARHVVSSTRLTVSASNYLDRLSDAATSAASPAEQQVFSFTTTASPSAPSPSSPSSLSTANDIFATVPVLSLRHADVIANNVIRCCERNGFNPVTVVVLDASGNTIVMKRMDGCSPVGTPDIAKAKAYSCIVNKYPSRTFRDRYTADEASAKFCQMVTMVNISGNQMAPFPGGIVLQYQKNHRDQEGGGVIIGAVGVSGAAGDEDEYCAIRSVVEANIRGLTTVPEQHSCATAKDNY